MTHGSPTKNRSAGQDTAERRPASPILAAPSISLPKGGGAIRDMGEKFAANHALGTGSLTVPLVSTAGRSGFGPRLNLAYDSGAGNGPFGLGWTLGLPAISRKTDKGLPRYRDHEESDVFLVSGAEDLVPILDAAGNRVAFPRTVHGVPYTIHLYRPRIEGLFARIERWADPAGVSHWRTITRDNVTTIFGLDAGSRIADPDDPRRVFSYLIALSFDDKGNATRYDYVPDDSAGVSRTAAHEAHRTAAVRGTQRYLKHVRYGNVQPYFPDASAGGAASPLPADWHFHLVLDYGDHRPAEPAPTPDRPWSVRPDPFSSFRAGFEVRTYRRCKRVLLFHDFPAEATAGGDTLVGSAELQYSDEVAPGDPRNPIYTFLVSATQTGRRSTAHGPEVRSMPPLEFSYSGPILHTEIRTLTDRDGVENLPQGLDGSRYQWVDLDGEGLSGVLSEQNGAWGYKRNLGPLNWEPIPGGERVVRAGFGPVRTIPSMPVSARLGDGQRLLDLTGGGRLSLAAFDGPAPGFFKHTADDDWEPFKTFSALPRVDWADPNLKFVDLTGDGRPDLLITEDEVFTAYPSLGEEGFGTPERIPAPADEAVGPRVVFADGTETLSLADMSGDGLSDIVRVRNGEVCYWPNLGYGRFGARVTMDGAPRFTDDERFDPRRVRWADIDGSGTTDLLYVGEDGVHVCFNRSGNSWAAPRSLGVFPSADPASAVQVADLFGNGTACLVWSSPWPGDAAAPLRYVDLMGSQKPHLMVRTRNNLGAETRVAYAPSTRFYLEDERAGRPWITRLPFPVHVVARVEVYDWIGRSRFVSRYAYHHGYFDGEEREFRGFGMVEQWDSEVHRDDTLFPEVDPLNEDAASLVPPVHTRTWFHTGAFVEGGAVSAQYEREYWVEPGLRGDAPALRAARGAQLVPDTVLEAGLPADDVREAYRALKGSVLRIELFSDDGTPRAEHPYTVTEQNFTVRRLQARGPNRHSVFVTHARESLVYHYERQPDDPRIGHDLTLEVDEFGNVRRSVSVGYPRREGFAEPEPHLSAAFRTMLHHDQTRLHVGASEHRFTASVNRLTDVAPVDAYRAPLPCETLAAELTGFAPASTIFAFAEIDGIFSTLWDGAHDIPYEEVSTPDIEGVGPPIAFARRIVGRSRTVYRRDDLNGLLPLGALESHALPGESYRLALTPGLIGRLLPSTVNDALLAQAGYVRPPGQDDWWIPSGRVFYSAGDADPSAVELGEARAHFYQVRRVVDPFGAVHRVTLDPYDLLPVSATDPLGNLTAADNDYRVLQSFRATDPNGNVSEVAFDCLGQAVGSAVRGKAGEGDSLAGFVADLSDAEIQGVRADPFANPAALLGQATSRFVLDRFAYMRTRDQAIPDPPMVYTLTREKHVADLAAGEVPRLHHLFAYSDGLGREVQHKTQAEPGPVPGVAGIVARRWVGSGWVLHDNAGNVVQRFDPFFSTTHAFEFNRRVGVSSRLFYDPAGRLVGTLHPDHTFDKTVFEAWRQSTWDLNDTVAIADPRTDPDLGAFFTRLLGMAPGAFRSWHDLRIGGALGADAEERAANQDAAQKATRHAGTPTVAHFDSLGRTCVTVLDNGVLAGVPQRFPTRTAMDTESKPLAAFDAAGRRVMEFCLREPLAAGGGGFRYVAGYDVAGNTLYRNGMDGGERRTLHDAASHLIRTWDARGFVIRDRYDLLQRPTHRFTGRPGFGEILVERLVYGEKHPDLARNLKGKLFRHYDGSGVASNDRFDFKGNLVESGRQLSRFSPPGQRADYYATTPDWSALAEIVEAPALDLAALDAAAAPALDAADAFVASTRFDALNRPIQVVAPHTAGGRPSVFQPAYNEATFLERLDVWVRQAAVPGALLAPGTADVRAVTGVEYSARGQRLRVELGNGAVTRHTYDDETFRLTSLTTTRPNPDPDAVIVQALTYSYDPIGNVTRIRDAADIQNVVYFRNQRVEPSSDYSYDPTYRLIRATGREHLGQNGGALRPAALVTSDESARTGLVASAARNDGNAMGNYTERYDYDDVGNLTAMIHEVASGGWTRRYSYAEPSRISAAEWSNRLSATSRPGDSPMGPYGDTYAYDEHGSMTRMAHLPGLTWDEHDRLQSTTRQQVNAGMPETTFYGYDGEGQRRRKTTFAQAAAGGVPVRKSERLYLGPIEIHREFDGAGQLAIERETLHVRLDQRGVVLVETRTVGTAIIDPAPAQLVRYRFANHLGSAMLELDADAAVITYEEYFPYGASSYQGVRSQTETPKRYRYTGKERDEESDLYYHGARYYAPWLGRWTSCDPIGMEDGPNLYLYVHANPVAMSDPTGMWGWREVAIVAAVVVVGVVVTVATAGVAGPIVAGAIASVGMSGAAATVATGVVVGAVAGAAGGAASELTRQVASGEQISGRAIGKAALVGAALGAVTGGLGAAATTVRGAATIARASTAVRATSVARAGATAARTVSAGARAVARVPGVRQVVGAAQSLARGGGRALQAFQQASSRLGTRAAQGIFRAGSRGAVATTNASATGGVQTAAAAEARGAAEASVVPIRPPSLVDSNVLVRGAEGNPNALAAIRATDPRVTFSQLREFLDVTSEVQQVQRAQFLLSEGVSPISPRVAQLTTPELRNTFWRIARAQGAADTTADAALAIHGIRTGYPVVTGDGRLIRTVTETLRIPGINFVRVRW